MTPASGLPSKKLPPFARLRNLAPWLAAACILVPNIYVVIRGRESFPFTSAPMFGHYIGKEVPLFFFEMRGVTVDGAAVPLAPALSGRSESYFMRLFFGRVYGSTHAHSVFGDHADDTKEKFESRLQRFFKAYHQAIEKKREGASLSAIDLYLVRVDSNRVPLETQHLGTYRIQDNTYHHLWKGP